MKDKSALAANATLLATLSLTRSEYSLRAATIGLA